MNKTDDRLNYVGEAEIGVLAIVGQTASGKSDLALRLAKAYEGEIISADSWTVYKHFDIGTGKPNQSDRKAVKHWLLDVRQPAAGFSAPAFKNLALEAVKNIHKRGKLPIMAGGTGLYVDSVLYNFGFLPSTSAEDRAKLNAMSLTELLENAQIQKIDLTGIDKRNKRRVIRAIEAKGEKPTKNQLLPNALIVGIRLEPETLKRRIEQRVDRMMNEGLEREAGSLAKRYGWDIEPMKGIGYAQWRAYFEGRQTQQQTRQQIIAATNNLAKRQRVWLQRNPDIHWFDSADAAYNFLKNALST